MQAGYIIRFPEKEILMAYITRSCDLIRHRNYQKKAILMADISKSCDLFWDGISKKGKFDGLCKHFLSSKNT